MYLIIISFVQFKRTRMVDKSVAERYFSQLNPLWSRRLKYLLFNDLSKFVARFLFPQHFRILGLSLTFRLVESESSVQTKHCGLFTSSFHTRRVPEIHSRVLIFKRFKCFDGVDPLKARPENNYRETFQAARGCSSSSNNVEHGQSRPLNVLGTAFEESILQTARSAFETFFRGLVRESVSSKRKSKKKKNGTRTAESVIKGYV